MRSSRDLCVATMLCIVALHGCGGTEDDPVSAVDDSSTPSVTRSERVWVDASRSTPRTSRFPGAMHRELRTLVWQPAIATPLPLLVLAHGYGGLPEKFDAFVRAIAAAGYVVAAPAFPLTNEHAPGGHEVGLRDAVSQPGDVSFVLTQLLDEAASLGQPLAGRIRSAEIAVLGHSLGGVTAIALTRKACCQDARVGAAIFFAAPLFLADLFFSGPVSATGPRTMILHGTADSNVGYATATEIFALLSPPRLLIGLNGVGHSEALESQSEPPIPARRAAQVATIAYLNDAFRNASEQLDSALATLAAEGHTVQVDSE